MNIELRKQAETIVRTAINAVLPDAAIKRALEGKRFPGRVFLVAAGKAAWQMAKAADECLKSTIVQGIVITKYGHIKGDIADYTMIEAGHPIPDENSFIGTQKAIDMVSNLTEDDTVLFLLSGGGSALFEKPSISGDELQEITKQLLACGADIVEINTIRKRLSAVKGGKFAEICKPANIFSVVLSDVLGDPLDMIASGPAAVDSSTVEDVIRIANKYNLKMSIEAHELLSIETPKSLDNTTTLINGSVRELCNAAADACEGIGYETIILTDQLCCQAKEAGSFLSSIARSNVALGKKMAFIAGGETVVHLTGKGMGGRNQELALAASEGVAGLNNVAIFSIGSDGTDGPTDAAGGYVDGDTKKALEDCSLNIFSVLKENDAYNALKIVDGLIFTGPTGTNVNDVAVVLIN